MAARDEADVEYARRLENAFRRQARNIIYPDFKPKEDFPLWLSGYREKIRNAFGLTQAQNDEVDAEVVRSISGKLESGPALDAYHRLSDTKKTNYGELVKALSEEFLDPQEKRRFIDSTNYNKRKKGESLKDFMQRIIEDQNRYGDMTDKITVGGNEVPNPAKIKDGIRRFKRGIRTREGKKDSDQKRHMEYNLMKAEDLTWEHALEVAYRWEAANDADSDSPESSSDSDDAAANRGAVKDKKKIENAAIASIELANLSDRVDTNERNLKSVKSEQERLAANIASWKEETDKILSQILQAVQSLDGQME